MSRVQKIANLRTIKAYRGESLTIDLGKTISGTLEVWLKRKPTDLTYRSFTIVDGRYLFLSKEKTQDYYVDGVISELVEGKWYFDVRQMPEGSVDPNDEKIIITGSIDFSNHITDSNGTEVPQTPESESGMINLSNTSSVYGTAGQIVKAKELIKEVKEVKTIKATRAVALTIDLEKEYPDHKLEAWMKKDENANTYRAFQIVDQRYLFLPKAKTQDYYDIETGKIVEKVKGKWSFDVRAIPNAATSADDESIIVKGIIYFEDNVTDSLGQELVYADRPYANEFINLNDTPLEYTGQAGKVLRVNAMEDAVEFAEITSQDVTQHEGDITITTSQISDFKEKTNYVHDQGMPLAVWTISHGLEKKPSVLAVDTAETSVFGQIIYIDNNNITITFNAAFSGYAYLN
jgi:hypothetical protein